MDFKEDVQPLNQGSRSDTIENKVQASSRFHITRRRAQHSTVAPESKTVGSQNLNLQQMAKEVKAGEEQFLSPFPSSLKTTADFVAALRAQARIRATQPPTAAYLETTTNKKPDSKSDMSASEITTFQRDQAEIRAVQPPTAQNLPAITNRKQNHTSGPNSSSNMKACKLTAVRRAQAGRRAPRPYNAQKMPVAKNHKQNQTSDSDSDSDSDLDMKAAEVAAIRMDQAGRRAPQPPASLDTATKNDHFQTMMQDLLCGRRAPPSSQSSHAFTNAPPGSEGWATDSSSKYMSDNMQAMQGASAIGRALLASQASQAPTPTLTATASNSEGWSTDTDSKSKAIKVQAARRIPARRRATTGNMDRNACAARPVRPALPTRANTQPMPSQVTPPAEFAMITEDMDAIYELADHDAHSAAGWRRDIAALDAYERNARRECREKEMPRLM